MLGQVFALPGDSEQQPIMLAGGAVLDCGVYIVSRRPDMAPVVPGSDDSAWLSQRRESA